MNGRNHILTGDAQVALRRLANSSVDMVLTSPPYFRLRRYGNRQEIGHETSVVEWVRSLERLGGELQRVLTPTGTLWLNLGDTYATEAAQGAPYKSLLLGPEQVALALIRRGWLLRNKIVWRKTNPMPTSVRDRLACTYEYVYVFAKQPHYYFDLDAVRVPHTTKAERRKPVRVVAETWRGNNTQSRNGLQLLKAAGLVGHPLGKNPGDVWQLASSRYRGNHPATFPPQLAERCIAAGCPEAVCTSCRSPWRRKLIRAVGRTAVRAALAPSCACSAQRSPAVVLDPFVGSGTTAIAAEHLGRDWLGVELNAAYVAEALDRIHAARASPRAA